MTTVSYCCIIKTVENNQRIPGKMGLFTALSKNEQVLDALRQAIKEGNLPAGTRLSSVRQLAEEFSVSTKTVVRALEVLAAENLIRREQGRGVFVSGRNGKERFEIALAGFYSNQIRGRYFDFLCRIAQPPNRRPDFNFTIRSLGTAPENRVHFEIELRRLVEQWNVDCLLFHAPSLGKEELRVCMKLSVPVIFLGDFCGGLYPGMDFSQVTGDNVRFGMAAVRKMYSLTGQHELVVFSGSQEHYFNRYACDGVFAAAERLGIRIHLLEFPRGFTSRYSLEEQNDFLRRELEKRKSEGILENPLLDLGVGEPLDRGFSMLGHPCVIHSAEPAENGCFNFFQTINRQIERLLKNSTAHKKFCIEMDTVLKKRRSGF